MKDFYSLGLDFGTNSVRCLISQTRDGQEVGTGVAEYAHGERGVLLDPRDPDLARQHPVDYPAGMISAVHSALEQARDTKEFDRNRIIGIGVDVTGSTPLPLDTTGEPLAFHPHFSNNLNAMAWLWKDHTAHAEALAITRHCHECCPGYTLSCGGVYSPEWFFAKIWHCLNVDREVFQAAYTWAEVADWIPALLTGTCHPQKMKRNHCAAGHKALFNRAWGGLPSQSFLSGLDPALADLRRHLYESTATVDQRAGYLTEEWANHLHLPAGIPVAVGALDGHMGAIGAGVRPGVVVNIFGTSSVYMTVTPGNEHPGDIPGVCGVVDSSIVPGHYGVEAGQAATGDLFNWWVKEVSGGIDSRHGHTLLSKEAAQLLPGESGLLALDWNNGNRCLLVDPRLTGLLVGQTLQTRPAEIYRALIEATAFGARMILEQFSNYRLTTNKIINAGGIPQKNDLIMQIYADVTGITQYLSLSAQTCALGAAMCGAVAAGETMGGYDSIPEAQFAMAGVSERVFHPQSKNRDVYDRLFPLYQALHDSFGVLNGHGNLYHVMKDLLDLRDQVRNEGGTCRA